MRRIATRVQPFFRGCYPRGDAESARVPRCSLASNVERIFNGFIRLLLFVNALRTVTHIIHGEPLGKRCEFSDKTTMDRWSLGIVGDRVVGVYGSLRNTYVMFCHGVFNLKEKLKGGYFLCERVSNLSYQLPPGKLWELKSTASFGPLCASSVTLHRVFAFRFVRKLIR